MSRLLKPCRKKTKYAADADGEFYLHQSRRYSIEYSPSPMGELISSWFVSTSISECIGLPGIGALSLRVTSECPNAYELALAFLAFNDEDYARLQPTKPIIASIGQ